MQNGFDAETYLKTLTRKPGVYQMLDAGNEVLYVGKAKNLRNRVASYFRSRGLNSKTVALVQKIHSIQVTVTNSESEALILEQNLIKAHRPPYNILLRDDKSYPYILLTDHSHPRLAFHRGSKRKKGEYFGPFPNAGSVRESLHLLQKVFRVRQCKDSYYRNRTRPCLQYQIDRCTAPCVGKVSDEEYQNSVRYTRMFLQGEDQKLLGELADRMDKASQELEFEQAAVIRDQITDLRRMQDAQSIEGKRGDIDVLAAAQASGTACVHVLFVRAGRILGSRSYFPKPQLEEGSAELLFSFVSQYYLGDVAKEVPREILLDQEVPDVDVLESALADYCKRKVAIVCRARANRAQWVQLAATAAQQNLEARLANRQSIASRFESLQDVLQLTELPQRIECFDISHSSGEATVASCVVFDLSGARKTDYRRFNIDGVQAGDDYAAMEQALRRRFKRLQQGEGQKPDVLLIDGGKGQLSEAERVLRELAIDDLNVLAVAKGPSRKAGMEQIIRAGTREELVLNGDSPALHLIQQVRDESHRFAVAGHRARRSKKRNVSVLEGIEGVGSKRRQALLRHFGGLQEVQRASIQDLSKVPGISKKTATDIYHSLHSD